MIFGRSKILLTNFNLIKAVKCVCHNQIWLKCNAVQVRVIHSSSPASSKSNEYRNIKVSAESLKLEDENSKLNQGEKQLSESNIQSVESVEALLKMVGQQDISSLTPSKIIFILNQLQDLRSQNKSKLLKRTVVSTPAFLNLFSILENEIHKMSVHNLLGLYLFHKKFRIPDKVMDIKKVTLKINSKINELDFCQKVILYNLYSTSEEETSNEKSTLEYLIQSEVRRKLKTNLIEDKLDILSHSLMFPMSKEIKTEIIKTFLDLGREDWCHYDITPSFLKFFNYVHKDFPEFDDIQKRLLDILQECANDYKFISTVPEFFPILVKMVIFRKIEYRSYLFECILDNVVKYDLPFFEKIKIYDLLLIMGFSHYGLLENLIKTAMKDFSVLSQIQLFILFKAVANINCCFRKKEWECLFTSQKDLTIWDSEKKLFSYAVLCSTAGLFHNEVFKLLSKRFTKEEILAKKGDHCLNILLFNHAVKAWNPAYPGPFLSEEVRLLTLKEAQKKLDRYYIYWSDIIKELLETAIGMKDCILTCCWTKHGEIIDQVMALDENGKPCSLADVKKDSEGIIYIEDICLPPGYKLLLILNFHRGEKVTNALQARGKNFLKLNLIKELGFPVLYGFFDLTLAKKLSDSEKGQFLWNQIREKYAFMNKNKTIDNEAILIPLNTRFVSIHEPDNKKIDILISSEKSWLDNILPAIDGQTWYTDGSKKDSRLGSGIYYPEKELEISNYLDFNGSAYDAEVDALAACAQEAYTALMENKNVDNTKTVVNILTDSHTAIDLVCDLKPITSERGLNCKKILKKLSEKVQVRIIWVPGHSNIRGNIIAHNLAKKGASGIQTFSEKITNEER